MILNGTPTALPDWAGTGPLLTAQITLDPTSLQGG